jgi:hypothetical protein
MEAGGQDVAYEKKNKSGLWSWSDAVNKTSPYEFFTFSHKTYKSYCNKRETINVTQTWYQKSLVHLMNLPILLCLKF